MTRFRRWWNDTVDFDWLVQYHQARPFLRDSHRLLAAFAVGYGIVGVSVLHQPENPVVGPVSRAVVYVCSIGAILGGPVLYRRQMASRVQSAWFVMAADLGVGVVLLNVTPSQVTLGSVVLFIGMGNYTSVFHGTKAYVAHNAWVATILMVTFVRALVTGGTSVISLMITLVITALGLFVSGVLLRSLLVNLRRDAAHSAYDPLTGIRNRRGLEFALVPLIAAGSGSIVTAVLVDIDGFKAVNDKFGHDQGDAVLRLAAGRIDRAAPPPMIAARIGGEEFLVVSIGNEAVGEMTARRILDTVHEPTDPTPITVSIGVFQFPVDELAKDPESALAFLSTRADAAMYDAKRQGGNRVAFGPASDGHSESSAGGSL